MPARLQPCKLKFIPTDRSCCKSTLAQSSSQACKRFFRSAYTLYEFGENTSDEMQADKLQHDELRSTQKWFKLVSLQQD
ncbi:hypothetical protein vseg_008750 [Gypsophila vaccaria]